MSTFIRQSAAWSVRGAPQAFRFDGSEYRGRDPDHSRPRPAGLDGAAAWRDDRLCAGLHGLDALFHPADSAEHGRRAAGRRAKCCRSGSRSGADPAAAARGGRPWVGPSGRPEEGGEVCQPGGP